MPPEPVGDGAVYQVTSPGSRKLDPAASEVAARDGDKTPIAQLSLDQTVMHVAPGRTLHDDLFLHQLVAYRPALRTFDDVVVRPSAVARRVANDALDIAAHLFERDVLREGYAKESQRHHRDELDGAEVNELEPRIRLVDVMDDQVSLTVEEPFPGASDSLGMRIRGRDRRSPR